MSELFERGDRVDHGFGAVLNSFKIFCLYFGRVEKAVYETDCEGPCPKIVGGILERDAAGGDDS